MVYQRPKCPRLSVEACYLSVHLARKIKGMEITDKKISEIWIFLVRLSSFLAIREDAIVFATGNVRKRKLDYLLNFPIFSMLSSIMMEVGHSSHVACQEQSKCFAYRKNIFFSIEKEFIVLEMQHGCRAKPLFNTAFKKMLCNLPLEISRNSNRNFWSREKRTLY